MPWSHMFPLRPVHGSPPPSVFLTSGGTSRWRLRWERDGAQPARVQPRLSLKTQFLSKARCGGVERVKSVRNCLAGGSWGGSAFENNLGGDHASLPWVRWRKSV